MVVVGTDGRQVTHGQRSAAVQAVEQVQGLFWWTPLNRPYSRPYISTISPCAEADHFF